MKKQIFLIIIALFIVAAAVSLYLPATSVNVTDSSRSTPELPAAEKFRWAQHWDELNLAEIKRDYQLYTVAEMQEMWEAKLIAKYGGAERLKQAIGEGIMFIHRTLTLHACLNWADLLLIFRTMKMPLQINGYGCFLRGCTGIP